MKVIKGEDMAGLVDNFGKLTALEERLRIRALIEKRIKELLEKADKYKGDAREVYLVKADELEFLLEQIG